MVREGRAICKTASLRDGDRALMVSRRLRFLSQERAWQAAASSRDRMGRRTNGSTRYNPMFSQAASYKNSHTEGNVTSTRRRNFGARSSSLSPPKVAVCQTCSEILMWEGTLVRHGPFRACESCIEAVHKGRTCSHRAGFLAPAPTLLPDPACS